MKLHGKNARKERQPDMNRDAFLELHLPGKSPAASELRRTIARVNNSYNQNLIKVILITGESGAGKNHLARVIAGHRYWLREINTMPPEGRLETFTSRFAEIALPTLPDTLVEAELFGYRKGAFTGANANRPGLLGGEADDILLDEIGDASAIVQAKILGVLETQRYRPVGGDLQDQKETTARFILATHRDLGSRVQAGAFREDLFWRATEFPVRVLPLREQRENIEDLIRYQLTILGTKAMYDADPKVGRPLPTMSGEDLAWARGYEWPGNIRQLRHSLVQWLANEGRVALHEIVDSAKALLSSTALSAASPERMKIRGRLDDARSAGRAVASTLGNFIDDVRRNAELEVVEWYDSVRPSLEELKRLFPEADPTAIRSKLSQWRTR